MPEYPAIESLLRALRRRDWRRITILIRAYLGDREAQRRVLVAEIADLYCEAKP